MHRNDRTCTWPAANAGRHFPYIQRHPAIAPRRTRQPRTKYERCATSEACVRFETLAASEQSGLETCASVLLYSRTDITWHMGTEVCAEASLIVSANSVCVNVSQRRASAPQNRIFGASF